MTHYIMVNWHHAEGDEPVALYHEIGTGQREKRRVEQFSDGHFARTDCVDPAGKVSLSVEPLPSVDAIGEQSDFSVSELSRASFEDIWKRAGSPAVKPGNAEATDVSSPELRRTLPRDPPTTCLTRSVVPVNSGYPVNLPRSLPRNSC